jgi:hypothetical protein
VPAEVASRGRTDRAGALRHRHAANVFRRYGAADVQAVIVTVAHVAERHAIQREAELLLGETADRKARRPFVGAEWIGRFKIHARQFFEDFQRAGTGHGLGDIGAGDVLHLARLALAGHFDHLGRDIRRIGGKVSGRGSRGEGVQDQQAGRGESE